MNSEEFKKELNKEPCQMTPDERFEQAKMFVKFDNEYQKGQQFIINNKDSVRGRYYCAQGYFLVASAICDHFGLEYYKDQNGNTEYIDPYPIIEKYIETDPKKAVEIWAWVLNEFGSNFDYDFLAYRDFYTSKFFDDKLYSNIVERFHEFGDAFLEEVVNECDNSNKFLSMIVNNGTYNYEIIYVLAPAIHNKKYLLCKAIIDAVVKLDKKDEAKRECIASILKRTSLLLAKYECLDDFDFLINALIPDAINKFNIENEDITSFATQRKQKLKAKLDAIEKKKQDEQKRREEAEKELKNKEEIEKYNKKHKRAVIIFFVFVLLIYIFGKINSTVMPKALVKSDIVKLFEEYGAESVDISFDLKEDRTYITAEIDKLPKLSESNVSELNIQLCEVCNKRSTGKYEFKFFYAKVKQKMNDGIYFDTEHSYDRKFETTTKATTAQYYDSCNSGEINQEAVDSAKEWANSRTTTKYRKRSYSKTTSKDRYNAKKYGNAEDFYDDNYYDFDSYEDAEDYYDDHD